MITYNHAPYISQAIESVLIQKTNFTFELVIGEDCSTDNTHEIVMKYKNKYPEIINLLPSEHNLGLMKNMYRTEKACRGKYIAYCEGDDYWHRSDKLQIQSDYLEIHPECGLIHSDYNRLFNKSGKTIYNYVQTEKSIPPDDLDFYKILHGGKAIYILLCSVMVRKDLLWKVIDEDPYIYQTATFLTGDTVRWAEISLLAKTAYINESLATNRLLEESVSRTKDLNKQINFGKNNRELFMYLIDKHKLSKNERRKHEIIWCDYALLQAFHNNNRMLGLEARTKLPRLTFRQKYFFLGSQNSMLNHITKIIWSIYRWFKSRILTLKSKE
jgi:glycosyltransferase involved in cell wall biosynthesis